MANNKHHNARYAKQAAFGVAFLGLLAAGWFYPILGYFIPACMVIGVGLALFMGRKWCDWWCPRGSFLDAMASKVSRKARIPDFFRSTPTRVAMMSVMMGIMTWQLFARWPDPLGIGAFFIIMLSATTVLAIVFSFVLHQRTWCYICPVGTISSWVSPKLYAVSIDHGACNDCGLCAKKCPVQIAPNDYRSSSAGLVSDADCVKCSVCVSSCPKKALKL